MGKSYTPKYRIEFTHGAAPTVPLPRTWNSRQMGRPSPENIEKMVRGYMDSCKPGGVNAHLTKTFGGLMPNPPKSVRVVSQKGANVGETVAEWTMPMFMVVG